MLLFKRLSKAYRNTCSRGEKLQHGFANQCYYCNKFFARPDKHKRHIEHCSGVPGLVYSFNNQNLVTFEDNLGYKCDLPAVVLGVVYGFNNQNFVTFEDNLGYKGNHPEVACIDFETTASTGNCFNLEQKSMFLVSYVIIVAFHPKLKMERVIIQRSFGHSLEKLKTIDYLTNEQMSFPDVNLIKQLKDSALNVHRKKRKYAMAQMFSMELSLVKKTILSWLNPKIKSQHP